MFLKHKHYSNKSLYKLFAAAILVVAACCFFNIYAFAQGGNNTNIADNASLLEWLDAFNHNIEQYLHAALTAAIIFLELLGAFVIIFNSIKSFILYWKNKASIRLSFAQGLATGLEFKLAGEILRTVLVRSWDEILIVGAIIILRAALNFLIHWEIRQETAHIDLEK